MSLDEQVTPADGTAHTEVAPAPTTLPALAAAVVFTTSAAVLVLEIVAMRLVAPYVGVTLQTSSAVIGTALGAMALGAWSGGRLADRVADRLVAPALVVGGLLTILTVPIVRQVGTWVTGRAVVPSVLLMAVLAVFAPSAVLSSVSPMVVRSQLADLGRSGSVVGRLSGIGTLGAIAATFLTGFVLLATVRTSHIVVGTGVVLVLAGGALATFGQRRDGRRPALRAMAIAPVLPWLFVASPNPCQVETDYHCANVVVAQDDANVRELHLDTLAHSAVDLVNPKDLRFDYVTAVAAAVDAVGAPPAAIRAFYIGGGGLTVPAYVAAARPGSTAVVAEIDGGVVRIDRDQLGAASIPGMTVDVADARTALARQPSGVYDLVVGDAFGGVAVPWHLTTLEAVRDLHRTLAPGGVYAVNVIDYRPDRFARAEVATLRQVFRHVVVTATDDTLLPTGTGTGGNHVMVASDAPIDVAALRARLHAAQRNWVALDERATAAWAGAARPLTDELAPVDQLLTPTPPA